MKRSNLFFLFSLFIVVIMMVTLAACSKTTTPATTKTTTISTTQTIAQTTTTASKYGGTLRILTPSVMQPVAPGWPAEMTGMDFSLSMCCLDRLLMGDSQGNPMPMLATAWTVAPDKLSITFTLRQGVKFHDGTDFNADAVKFNMEAVMAAKVSGTELWKSVGVIDNYTVRLNLTAFQNTIFSSLAGIPGYMVSPTAYQKNGKDWMKMNPVGTGPFKFQSFQRDVSLKFVKNTDYWQEGKPYLDAIEFPFFANETAGAIALKAGDGDMMTLMEIPVLKDLRANGFDVPYPPDAADTIAPDSANPKSPFADLRVREAVEYAIDKEGIANSIGPGFYQVADQVALPGYVGHIPDLVPRSYDLAKAKQLLTDAGYAHGFQTEIIAPNDANPTYLSAVQANLKAVGIDAKIEIVEWLRYFQYQTQGWNGLLRLAYNSFPNYNSILVNYYLSTTTKPISIKHPAGFDDALMDSVTSITVDPQKVQKVTKMEFDNALVIPVFGYTVCKASAKYVHDTNFKQFGFELWTPEDAWISK